MSTSEQTAPPLGPDDVNLLMRLTALSETSPCYVPRADLLRLMELAGYDRAHRGYQMVEMSGDPVKSWSGSLHFRVSGR